MYIFMYSCHVPHDTFKLLRPKPVSPFVEDLALYPDVIIIKAILQVFTAPL